MKLGNERKLFFLIFKSSFCILVARKTCYRGWKLEYQGYLMAGTVQTSGGSAFNCVDHHPDTVHGGSSNMNAKPFFFVEARCGSLKCPPYVNGRELVCAVCSKK